MNFTYWLGFTTNFIAIDNRAALLEGTVSCGLSVLCFVLTVKDHSQLVFKMEEFMGRTGPFLEDEGALGHTAQLLRRDKVELERDMKEERRDPLPFVGDHESKPPVAWTLIWGGTYSNLFGWWIPNDLRYWGYVFWDKKRIDYVDVKK